MADCHKTSFPANMVSGFRVQIHLTHCSPHLSRSLLCVVPPMRMATFRRLPFIMISLIFIRGFQSVPKRAFQRRLFAIDENKLTSMQKETSSSQRKDEDNTIESSQEQYTKHQERVFDEMADFFESTEATPDDVVPVLRLLTKRSLSLLNDILQAKVGRYELRNITYTPPDTIRVLDVACGTGALFPYFVEAADELNLKLDLVGVDLSSKMVQGAQRKAQELSSTHHKITVVQKDITEYQPDTDFQLIMANACFGNFYNQSQVLDHLSELMTPDSCLFVTHPLGASFVEKLHNEDPSTVPHLLPNEDEWERLLRHKTLQPIDYITQMKLGTNGDVTSYPLYSVGAVRVRHKELDQVIRLRGTVASGYGRGGKKLGFPTANLPSSDFQDALKDLPTGVYIGWAVIEDQRGVNGRGRNVQHKAVVNIGYSPTFEGEENREKIVEAHLMPDEPLSDFYGETMRLQLAGFMRPEIKFPSFPALIAQITADMYDTKEALDMHPFKDLKLDAFLIGTVVNTGKTWIGFSGGNESSSWEFEDLEESLKTLPRYR